ncbi:MAG TPA: hypothetical protein VHE33_06095 [Acidobacteriaceae bacterium]|nr:hypothetical protein [Acidobacteriaceae bacterium]
MKGKMAALRCSILAAGVLVLSLPAASQTKWEIIGPGGGGTTIGPTISPHDPAVVVEHCDMTGGYVTQDNGRSWHMFNLRGGMNVFAFDPVQPHVIYAGNAGLWRSTNAGQNWSLVFPDPRRNTVEHQVGDHADYSLTSDDPTYPGGEISAIALSPAQGSETKPRIYVAFATGKQSSVVLASEDDGTTWRRLTTIPQHVLLLSAQQDRVTAIAGNAAYQIEPSGRIEELGHIPVPFHAAGATRSSQTTSFYATGTDGLVYSSRDGGRHWDSITPQLHQSAGRFEAIAATDANPNVAYVGFRRLQIGEGAQNLFNGIAKTTDGGRSWTIVFRESNRPASNLKGTWIEQRARQGNDTIWFDTPYSLAVAPSDPKQVYATDLFRTYRTLDGGVSWKEVNSVEKNGGWSSPGLDVTTNYGVQFDPFDSHHIYIDSTDIGLFQSRDGGRTWIGSSEGVPDNWRNTTYWLAFDPTQRGLMWGAFSGTHDLPRQKMWRNRSPQTFTGGVAVSTDGGMHWQPSASGLPQDSITHILLDPNSPPGKRTLYVCAFGHGVYKSVDSGKTWARKSEGIEGSEPFAWRITRDNHGTLYLVVARRSDKPGAGPGAAGALYRSIDAAEHWQRVALPEGVTGPTALEIDPRDSNRLYLTAWGREGISADHDGGVFVSEDAGKTWKNIFSEGQHVYDLTIDPSHPDTLYITGFDAAAYRSVDRGAHWARIQGYDFKWGHRVTVDPNDPTQIYINTYGGGVWHGPAKGDPNQKETILNPVPVAHE